MNFYHSEIQFPAAFRNASRMLSRLCLTTLVAIPLLAHDLYLMPKPFSAKAGETITVAFHNGDDFPVPDRPPKVENVLNASMLAAAGKTPFRNLRVEGKFLLADVKAAAPGTAILSAHTRPQLIELEASKFLSYLKHEGLDHVIQYREKKGESSIAGKERYSKYVKSLVTVGQSSGAYKQLVGFPIEIVPETDPAALKPGAKLPVRILFRGKPAADLQIEMAWLTPQGKAERKIAGRTDRAGKLQIPIGSRGIWKLHSVLMERCQDPSAADWESFWSSLTFEVK